MGIGNFIKTEHNLTIKIGECWTVTAREATPLRVMS
jgi:hypothetical protein